MWVKWKESKTESSNNVFLYVNKTVFFPPTVARDENSFATMVDEKENGGKMTDVWACELYLNEKKLLPIG